MLNPKLSHYKFATLAGSFIEDTVRLQPDELSQYLYQKTNFSYSVLREVVDKLISQNNAGDFIFYYEDWINKFIASNSCESIMDNSLKFGEIDYTIGTFNAFLVFMGDNENYF